MSGTSDLNKERHEGAHNNAINSDVKKLRRSLLAMQLFDSGYGWRYVLGENYVNS